MGKVSCTLTFKPKRYLVLGDSHLMTKCVRNRRRKAGRSGHNKKYSVSQARAALYVCGAYSSKQVRIRSTRLGRYARKTRARHTIHGLYYHLTVPEKPVADKEEFNKVRICKKIA